MVDSTVSIFLRIQNELLPTPAKSHYTFNLRDVSRVFQGVLMVTTANCADRNVMARLWTHENARVFHDRLIDTADKQYFTHMLYDILANRLGVTESYEALFEVRHEACKP
jgi:dynein heavy chain